MQGLAALAADADTVRQPRGSFFIHAKGTCKDRRIHVRVTRPSMSAVLFARKAIPAVAAAAEG